MKKFVNKNKFYIIFFIGFFLISLLFPYSGDDWVWGTYKLDFNILTNLSADLELNGRYIGNILAIILAKNIYVRGIIMSLTLTLIFKLINKYTGSKDYLVLLLLLLMPACIMKQVIPWSAGFANYTISILVLFYIFDILRENNQDRYMLIFLMCFIGSLFLENFTIFLFGFTLFLNIRYYIKNKKINKLYLFAFLGSVIGSFIMFSQPSYIRTINGDNQVRYVGQRDNIILINYFFNVMLYGVSASFIIYGLLLIVLFVYANKLNKLNVKTCCLFGIGYIMLIYILFTECNPKLYEHVYFNGCICTLLVLDILTILLILFRKDKKHNYIWHLLLLCVFIDAPLMIVSTVGPRNFLIVYLLVGIILIRLCDEYFGDNKIIKKVLLFVICGLTLYYGSIYYSVQKAYVERDNYVLSHSCYSAIYVPRLPHHKYVWWPDFENTLGDYYPNYYKKYHNLDESIHFVYEDYDFWKKHKDNISTCS